MTGTSEDAVMSLFQSDPSARLTFGQIAEALDGDHPDLSGAVDGLVQSGRLWQTGRRYALPEELGIFRGKRVVRSDGSGFVKSGGLRIEIDRRNISGALDGDSVIVRKLQHMEGTTFRGKVERIESRSREGISGVVRKRGGDWVIDPVDPSLPRNIRLRTGPRPGITQGRLVFAELDYSQKKLTAILQKDIGDPDSPVNLLDSVALDHGLPSEFGDELEEAAKGRAEVSWDLKGREDLRDLHTVTVDPVDARDFDDAISLEETDGYTLLYVHIADVAFYVRPGEPLDVEARSRGTSVYLPDRVIPMLPHVLSDGACSLRPGEERPARSVVMKFDGEGERVDFRVVPSLIRSDHRMTYEEALDYLQGDGSDPATADLFSKFARLSKLLDGKREERGALDLETAEYRVSFGRDGWPDGFHPVRSDIAHRMIENFMVEANRAVADHCDWTGLPVLYRVHDEPAQESVERLEQKLDEFDLSIPGGRIRNPSNLKALLGNIESEALRDLISEHVLRSLKKAVYKPSNDGHFGLALRSYMHFTSPIRRYPDLLVHQMLSMQEAGEIPVLRGDIGELAESCSATEENAESAEREATELMALLYLSKRIGSVHEGVVTGVKGFGVFVRLEGIPVEGLAHGKDIRRSGIAFNGPGGIFREGSRVRVSVLSVDVLERRLSLITLKGAEVN